ncbi:sensor histidine kinase [Chitinophaga pendula]|uniref:sensor histidine kinase n=1 Tax=Chitinophaga pendula TaxID=2849666 RepID=UPI001CED8602|nr:ATP-binding protein [Chitinophaga pendula]UCJ08585.1 sensor histidine kinase [Chitinophaga pendula]
MGDKIFYTTIFISLLIAIIIVFFVVSIILYHRRYIKLQRARISAKITILENERKRIAADLHDALGPLLSTVKLNINSIEVEDAGDQEIIQKSGRYIDEIIQSLRQISYNLLPNTLERKGLPEAVREFIRNVSRTQGPLIDFQAFPQLDVPPEKAIHIFRIIQEIVHNTIKHAQARELQIVLTREQSSLLLLAKENGRGFDVKKTKNTTTGLGIKSLEIRADIMHGTFSIHSHPGQGTQYFIKIPVG